MSEFRTKLIFEDDQGLPLTLVVPLVYASDSLQRVLTIPAGFVTDLASIPQVLWNILPPIGRYDHAAVVHDFLYQNNGVTRAQADVVLREAMEVKQVPAWMRWTIYSGVRVGGWLPWKRYRSRQSPS